MSYIEYYQGKMQRVLYDWPGLVGLHCLAVSEHKEYFQTDFSSWGATYSISTLMAPPWRLHLWTTKSVLYFCLFFMKLQFIFRWHCKEQRQKWHQKVDKIPVESASLLNVVGANILFPISFCSEVSELPSQTKTNTNILRNIINSVKKKIYKFLSEFSNLVCVSFIIIQMIVPTRRLIWPNRSRMSKSKAISKVVQREKTSDL